MGEVGEGVIPPPPTISGSGGAATGGSEGTDIGNVIAGAGGGVTSSFPGDGVGSSGGNVKDPAFAAGAGEDIALGFG